jgi:hypothetical protein
MERVAIVEGTEYWTLGKVKRTFHVSDQWLLKLVAMRLVRVLLRQGCTPRYSIADVERLSKEYPPNVGTKRPARYAASLALAGKAR